MGGDLFGIYYDFSCLFSLYGYRFGTKHTFEDNRKNRLARNLPYKFMCIIICSNLKHYLNFLTLQQSPLTTR